MKNGRLYVKLGAILLIGIIFLSYGGLCDNNGRQIITDSSAAPTAPTNLVATAVSATQVDLTWQDNSNNEDGFKIERSTDGITYALRSTLPANTTSYGDTTVSEITGYYYRAIAYNAYSDSESSNIAQVTTPWTITSLDTVSNVGGHTSMVLDSQEKVHISYYDYSNADLKYITNISGTWVSAVVDSAGEVGEFSSIAIDHNSKVHISYYDRTNANLKYATNASGSWQAETIDAQAYNGFYSSIGIDSNDNVHIAYYDSTNTDLKYATNISGTWQSMVIDSLGYVGLFCALAIDADNKVHISYYDQSNGDLRYANNATGSWLLATIDSAGNVGFYTDIAVDSDNKIHISYADWGNRDLKYAKSANGVPPNGGITWDISTVDTTGDVGNYTAIVVDSKNNAHISYYDATNKLLKYATNQNNSVWETTAIDGYLAGRNGVGEYTSIALGYNTAYIAYLDNRNWDLKYATNSKGLWLVRPPANLNALAVSSEQIDISWQDDSQDESGFKIERKTANGTYVEIASVISNTNYYADTAVVVATTYYYRVKAWNQYGNSLYSNEANATSLYTPPPAPVLVVPENGAVAVSPSPIFNWQAASYTMSWQIQVAQSQDFAVRVVDVELSQTSLAITSPLSQLTTYYWRVKGKNPGGAGEWSAPWSFTTSVAPPTLASPSDNAVNLPTAGTALAWNAVTGVTSYYLQVAADADFTDIVIDQQDVPATSYQVSGLLNSKTYYWRVRANHTSGSSPWTASRSFTTIVAIPLQPTLGLPANTATGISTRPLFSWPDATDAASYRIQVAADAGFNTIVIDQSGLAVTSYQSAELTLLTVYYWRVQAVNIAGTSPWSAAWSFTTTISAPTLSAPANNSFGMPLNPTLAWSYSTPQTTYQLQVSTGSGFGAGTLEYSGITATSYALSSMLLTNNTTYYWRVRAINSSGTSDWSAVRTFTTVVGEPALTSPANNSDGVNTAPLLTWDTPNGATAYRLQMATDANFTNIILDQSGIANTTFQSSGLSNWTNYYWRVMASNSGGPGNWSAVAKFTTIVAAPVLTAPANNTNSIPTINPSLSWATVSGATSYRIQVAADTSFNTIVKDQPGITSTSYSSLSLVYATNYYWRVQAANAGGTGAWSGVFGFRSVIPPTTLAAPGDNATLQPLNATLQWNSSLYATSYRLQVSAASDFASTVIDLSGISGTSAQLSGLSSSTLYYWRVQVVSASQGASNWSESRSFTTVPPIPAQPVLFSPESGADRISTNVTLRWNTADYAVSYRVQVSTASDFASTVLDQSGITGTSCPITQTLNNLTAYWWRVNATNDTGSSAWSAVWSFTTIPVIPDQPNLVSPANGILGISLPITFTWDTSNNAATYRFRLSTDSSFSSSLIDQSGLTAITYPASGSLVYGTTYYWQIKAINGAEASDWSATWSFRLVGIPVLVSPTDGTLLSVDNCLVTWSPSNDNTSYRLQVSKDPNFATTILDQAGLVATFYTVSGLTTWNTYHWRVQGISSVNGQSGWPASLSITRELSSQGGNDGWSYFKPIVITNSGALRSNYQIPVTPFTDPNFLDNSNLAGSWHFSQGYGNAVADMSGNMYSGSLMVGGTLVDNCDAAGSWSKGGAAGNITATTSIYKEGAGAVYLAKSGTTSTDSYFEKTISATDMQNKFLNVWLHIASSSALDRIAQVELYILENGYTWYIYKSPILPSTLQVGWNLLSFNTASPSGSSGIPALSAVTKIRIDVDTKTNADTFAADEIIMDYWFLTDKLPSFPAWTDGRFGKALSLDGASSYVNIPYNVINSAQSFTVEAWVKATTLTMSDWQKVIASDRAGGNSWDLCLLSDNAFSFYIWNTAGSFFNARTASVSANTWYHLVGVYDSMAEQINIYLNGVGVAPVTVSGTAAESSGPLRIGVNTLASATMFDGAIDEVKIYSRALTAAEIAARYNSNNPKVRHDYADIRFTDNNMTQELSYWQESDTKFWVKVPTLSTGNTTIRMFYGNPSAANASNGNNVFDLYDPVNRNCTWTKYPYNPVLPLGNGYGSTAIRDSAVIREADGTYKMWYSADTWKIAYATSSDGINWSKLYPAPLLAPDGSFWWETNEVRASTVTKESDNIYRMWYTGKNASNYRIGYATSTNGVNWTRYISNPVLNIGSGWEATYVMMPSVLKDTDGFYKMWYEGWVSDTYKIGYATSADGTNWQKYNNGANPVLTIGAGGTWDDYYVGAPFVMKESDGVYKMWYAGYDNPNWRIGYAYSTNGIDWTKYGTSAILNLGADTTWDDYGHYKPYVIREDGTYKMWYSGNDGSNWKGIGYAWCRPRQSVSPTPTVSAIGAEEGISTASNLVANVISSGQIDLIWQDNAPTEDGFKVERSFNGSFGWTQIGTASANATTYSDTTVTATNTYYYRVRAYTFTADGANSNQYQTGTTIPDAPTGLMTDTGTTSTIAIGLKWTDNSISENGFKIERSLTGTYWTEVATVPANTVSYADSSLPVFSAYYYRVRAYNGINYSGYSDVIYAASSLTNPGGSNWAYYRNIDITNSGSPITDYQVAVTPFTNSNFVNNAGLVGSYHFSELVTATAIADTSGSSNPCTLIGAITVNGKFGSGLAFNGTSGKYAYGSHITAYQIANPTVETWIKLNVNNVEQTIACDSIRGAFGDGRGFVFGVNNLGKLYFNIGNASGSWKYVYGSTILQTNTWYYVAGVYDGANLKVYLNGVENGNNNIGPVTISYTAAGSGGPNPSAFYIGIQHTNVDSAPTATVDLVYPFDGVLDEVKIYNRALSASEISVRYNSGSPLVRHDYGDIRFTNADMTQEYSYWPETDNKFWVKLPSVPAGASSIRMLYGNISATPSGNIANTFIFGDDFSSGTVDTAKWSSNSFDPGYYNIIGGIFKAWSEGVSWKGLGSSWNCGPTDAVIWETLYKTEAVNNTHLYLDESNNRFAIQPYLSGSTGPRVQYKVNGGSFIQGSQYYTASANTWYIHRIDRQSPTTFRAYTYDTNYTQLGTDAQTQNDWSDISFVPRTAEYNAVNSYIDWLRVRKYCASEPSVSVPTAGYFINTTTNLIASAASGTQMDITWTDNSVYEDGFKIERSFNGTDWVQIDTVGPSITTYADTTVTATNTYYYRVRSYGGLGNDPYSNAISPATTEPTAPSSLITTTITTSAIGLQWTDNSNNETGFRIETSGDGIDWTHLITVSANTTNHTDTGLAINATYWYRVLAANGIGNSGYSNTISTSVGSALITVITGGTTTNSGNYKIHTFTSDGTFNVTSGSGNIEVLVVGGGGSGGNHSTTNANGGGGGGGVVYNTAYAVVPGVYTVTIGAGGAAIPNSTNSIGNNGGNSAFSTLTALGGGGGGSTGQGGAAGSGGSGGGNARNGGAAGTSTQTGGYGNAGGASAVDWTGGGGGGGGSAGFSGSILAPGGDGGRGFACSIAGTLKYYAGGGGGGGNSSERAGDGYDGGGRGCGTTSYYNYSSYSAGVNPATGGSGTPNAIPNTGGGGGGGSYWAANGGWYSGSGSGGSGIVIVRYLASNGIVATGGTIMEPNTTIHTFISSGTFNVTSGSGNIEVLVVAGGGAGGGNGKGNNVAGGGGGGGGVVYNPSFPVTAQAYPVTVGAGGTGTTGNPTNGGNSVFSSLTAIGGGFGLGYNGSTYYAANSGGSGGGGGYSLNNGASGTVDQGNSGGNGATPTNYPGGGGGGAGATGQTAPSNNAGGNGGVGAAYSISGSLVYYGGGGGGGLGYQSNSGVFGIGGNGGGGNGSARSTGADGAPNTGGGGGGAGNNIGSPYSDAAGGSGGSGIVIVKYIGNPSANIPSNITATVISTARIDLSWQDNSAAESGFKIERSPDGTTAWTQIGTTGPNITTFVNDSGISAGTDYYYRIMSYDARLNHPYSAVVTANTAAPAVPSNLITTTMVATGGTITSFGSNYTIHTFTSSGTFNVTSGSGNIEVLVVAGGGSGGNHNTTNANGGGGGGGVVYNTAYAVAPGAYTVTIGAGGAAIANSTNSRGNNGGNSVFGTLTAIGGGGGGSTGNAGAAYDGGSGGGKARNGGAAGISTQTGGYGNAGGSTPVDWTGGGGGGAGSAGVLGNGGQGFACSIAGSTQYYAGGGGGSGNSSEPAGDGYHGGGRGCGRTAYYDYNSYPGEVNPATGGSGTPDAIPNTGGGGGGGSYWTNSGGWNGGSGAGGSGIVIVRYLASSGIVATGGAIMEPNTIIHTFTSSGTFNVTSGSGNIEVLVVAGGGSGGNYTSTNANGGGGGGGVIYNTAYAVAPGPYTVTIGAGGARIPNGSTGRGNNGGNSVFDTLTANGGGGGGATTVGGGLNGGSGGGAAYNGYTGGASTQGGGGFGNAGGASAVSYTGGGGGGAGSAGVAGNSAAPGGNGGAGFACSISGSLVYYAGGGGGGNNSSERAGDGFAGGGRGCGRTSYYYHDDWSYPGGVNPATGGSSTPTAIPNTGGGGGGGSYWAPNAGWNGGSGAGGSGIVIVRYLASSGIVATGGAIMEPNTTIHTFASSGAFNVTSGGSGVNLQWTDNSVGEQGFQLERSLDGANWTVTYTLPANTTVYNDSAVVPSTAYWYRVRAYNGINNSAYSTVISVKPAVVEVLVVGGGGGGGNHNTTNANGGGGGGGVVYNTAYAVAPGPYTVTIGAGGAAIPNSTNSRGNNGGNSVFGTLTAIGGGGGGGSGASPGGPGQNGGCGGGAAQPNGGGGGGGVSTQTDGYGNAGGNNSQGWTGGGGGGAGSTGVGGSGGSYPAGNGGQGFACSISGTLRYYAGGGGGGGNTSEWAGDGFAGGGRGCGNTLYYKYQYGPYPGGVNPATGGSGTPTAIPNTGGGGGGGSYQASSYGWPYGSGAGGSGIVIVRYYYPK